MGRYLVVANQTLGGEQLIEEIRRRTAASPSSFYVVAPLPPPPEHPGADLARVGGLGEVERLEEEGRHRAETATQARLGEMISRIKAEGAEAEGELGLTDPVDAVGSVMEDQEFDEIIVSTLPEGLSRWLRMDVASRIERRFKLPVTVVTAKG